MVAFTCLLTVFSQEVLNISCDVMTPDNKGVEGAQVTVYEGGTKVINITSDSKGQATFNLEYNKSYKVVITKSGMIQKRIDFQTDIDAEEQIALRKDFAVTLVDDCDGADVSAFNEPADIIKYDKREKNFVSDDSHFMKMQSKFSQAYQNLEDCKNEKFDDKIKQADQFINQGKYEEAIALYEEALEIYPNDGPTKRKISKARQSQQDASATDADYEKYIKEAEQYIAANDLSAAKQSFQAAQKLKPNESLPANQIAQIDATIASQTAALQKQKALDDEFNSLIAQGNSAMANQNYALAKQMFDKAVVLKPADAATKQRSADAQKGLEQQQKKQAEQEQINNEYAALIAQGQAAMQKGNFTDAEKQFQSALALKPQESEPRKLIKESQQLEAERKTKLLAQQQAENQKNYDQAITLADNLKDQKKYAESIAAYEDALKYKPTDTYAQRQIGQINNLIVEEAQAKKAAVENEYNQSMAQGDALKVEKSYSEAITAYQKALQAKPADPAASKKLDEAQRLLADQQRMEKEEKEKRTEYKNLLAEADGLFKSDDLTAGKSKYEQALALYASEQYPKNQIAKIENIQNREKVVGEYNQIIAAADALFDQKEWDEAIEKYNQAISVLPEKEYPKNQINAIKNNVSQEAKAALNKKFRDLMDKAETQITLKNYTEAKKILAEAHTVIPESAEPQHRINEVNLLISNDIKAAEQAEYDKYKNEAEKEIASKNYSQAKLLYSEAQKVQPENPEPGQRINDINVLISQESKTAILAEYNDLIDKAEAQATQKNYAEAKSLFAQAQKVLPDNPEPNKRINEINRIISDEAMAAELAEYNELKDQAEKEIEQKNYVKAKQLYAQAQKVQPENPYPQQRINEINLLVDNVEKQKVKEQYDELIANADKAFESNDYETAKSTYKQAITVLPTESYPQSQINKISKIQSENSRKKIQDEYNDLIADGDNFFEQKDYDQATKAYRKALIVIPDETYPQQRINEISAILTEQERLNSEKEALEQNYSNTIALADKYFKDKNYSLAKEEYTKALSVKPSESYPTNQINEINRLVAAEEARKAELLTREKNFKEAVSRADEYYKVKSYKEAKSEYEKALGYRADDAHSSSQIQRINQLLTAEADKQQKEAEKKAQYEKYITGGDKFYAANKLTEAKQAYTAALGIIPGQEYPRAQIRKIDEKIRALAASQTKVKTVSSQSQESTVQNTSTTTNSKQELSNFNFNTEEERQQYLEGLKGKYKEGITKETHQTNSGTVVRYVVIRNGEVNEYREIRFKWGGAQYKVNGKPSNLYYLKQQVKPQDGESFYEVN